MNDKKIKKNTKMAIIGTNIADSKKNTGITLIALVITVIVLLILAGVGISLIIGENGILKRTTTGVETWDKESVREEVELMLAEYGMKKFTDSSIGSLSDFLQSKGCEKVSETDDELVIEYKGYEIIIDKAKPKIKDISEKGGVKPLFDVTVSTVTGGDIEGGETEQVITVNITNIGEFGSNYTIEVKDENGNTITGTSVVGSLEGQASYIVTEDGKYTIKVTGTKDGVTRTTTKTEEIVFRMGTTTTQFNKAYGVIDIVWLDRDNNVISEPEAPILGGMKAVKWDGTPGSYTESSADSYGANWYSYTAQTGATDGRTSRWANAKTSNGNCYFVWIPRYAYKITYFNNATNQEAYRANSASTTGIIGYSTIEGMIDVTSGKRKLVEGTEPSNVTGSVKAEGYTDYIPHPAFEFDGAKAGIWVGKYESTGTISAITIKPGVASIVGQAVSKIFTACINIASANGISGDSHMMKNIEWGAVAYLTESRYGRNGTEIYINNSSTFITGNSGGSTNASSASGTTNAYNTANGVLASTTGNIYGIYDISGGAYENVTGYVDNATAQSSNNTNLYNAEGKYKDIYSIGTSDAQVNNYGANKGMKGDAVYEISTSYTGSTSWHGDYSIFPSSTAPVFVRGGDYSDSSNASVFGFRGIAGVGTGRNGFRAVWLSL